MTDTTIQLPSPPNSSGPLLDGESYTDASSSVTSRERVAVCPGVPTNAQTTIENVNSSSSGAVVIVAAVASQTVRIMRMILSVSAPTNIEFLDGSSTVLGGPYYLQGGGSITLDDSGEPWCITSSGNAFEINNGNAVAFTCTVWYTQS